METFLYSPIGAHSPEVPMDETSLSIKDSTRPVATFKDISGGLEV